MAITIAGSTTNITEAAVGSVTLTVDPANRVTGVGGFAQVVAAGGTAPYQYEVVSGKMPPGFAMRSDGYFVGIPTARGTFRLVIRATDSSTPNQCLDVAVTVVVS